MLKLQLPRMHVVATT